MNYPYIHNLSMSRVLGESVLPQLWPQSVPCLPSFLSQWCKSWISHPEMGLKSHPGGQERARPEQRSVTGTVVTLNTDSSTF